jgi:hypothetical protein
MVLSLTQRSIAVLAYPVKFFISHIFLTGWKRSVKLATVQKPQAERSQFELERWFRRVGRCRVFLCDEKKVKKYTRS